MRFTVRVFRERLTVSVCSFFPFGFESVIWDLIVLVPDQCLSIYFQGRIWRLMDSFPLPNISFFFTFTTLKFIRQSVLSRACDHNGKQCIHAF